MSFTLSQFDPSPIDDRWMHLALDLARQAAENNEVPIGAVVVQDGQLIGKGCNQPISQHDPTAHAEIMALRQACQSQQNYRLGRSSVLYVTLMPCVMCLGALLHARIGRVVVGCAQSRFGLSPDQLANWSFSDQSAWGSCQLDTGCLEEESMALLSAFFEAKRPSRQDSLKAISSVLALPNVNKKLAHWLESHGFWAGEDFLKPDAHAASLQIQHLAQSCDKLGQREKAMVLSLCHYLEGHPVRSWRQFLNSTPEQ